MYIFAPICVFPQARFCSSLLFCFRELNRFLEISVRDPRKILWVSRNSKLNPRNLVLEPRKSKLETRASKLDSRFLKTSRIKNRVSRRDCQLTFERYCIFCEAVIVYVQIKVRLAVVSLTWLPGVCEKFMILIILKLLSGFSVQKWNFRKFIISIKVPMK